MYRAVNFETRTTAACKVVSLQPDSPAALRKALDKEIKIHSALKHVNVLEFMHAMVVEPRGARSASAETKGKKRKRDEPETDDDERAAESEMDDDDGKPRFHAGVYMVLELAGGGDLFDKIGASTFLICFLLHSTSSHRRT